MNLHELRDLLDDEDLQLTQGVSADCQILAIPSGKDVAVYLHFPDEMLTTLITEGEIFLRRSCDDDRISLRQGPPANEYFERFVLDEADDEEMDRMTGFAA